jgi:hypothetical protein
MLGSRVPTPALYTSYLSRRLHPTLNRVMVCPFSTRTQAQRSDPNLYGIANKVDISIIYINTPKSKYNHLEIELYNLYNNLYT